MSQIQIQWLDDDQTIGHVLYPTGYTWEDYHQLLDSLVAWNEQRNLMLHFINEYERGAQLPATAPTPHHRRTIRALNTGMTIYVTSDAFLRRTLHNAQRSLNRRENIDYTFFDTVEEALAFIQEHREEYEAGHR